MYSSLKQELCQYLKQQLKPSLSTEEIDNLYHYISKSRIFTKLYIDNISIYENLQAIQDWILKIQDKQPIQYILGEAVFMDLVLEVDHSVLIPRPETEELVYALSLRLGHNVAYRILDIGTGSACIPIYLKKHFPEIEMLAIEISPETLHLARRNAISYQVDIHFLELDFLAIFPPYEKLDFIISNPPYIPKKDSNWMTEQVLNYEPSLALFPKGEDPDIFYKRIAEFGWIALNENGEIFCEINEFRSKEIKAIFKKFHYKEIEIIQDIQGKDRMIRVKKSNSI